MTKEMPIRYLIDKEKERYIPVSHVEAVIGLDDVIERIDQLDEEMKEIKNILNELKADEEAEE